MADDDTSELDVLAGSGGTAADLVHTSTRDPPPTDVSSAAQTGSTSIYDLINDKGTTAALGDLQHKKIAEMEAIQTRQDRDLAEDRTRAVNFLDREGVAANDLQKWDVKGEREKYRTDPIEQFGSLASVFAITAAAFTKAPMENALNGAAAAMNAARDGNEREYEKAYQAWKDNTNLAIKRHDMMHTNYADAMNLMTTDMSLGERKMKELFAKYGEQKLSVLYDHGYAPEVFETIASRAKAMEGMQKSVENIQEWTYKQAAFDAWLKQNPNAPMDIKMSVRENMMGQGKTDQDREWSRMWFATHPFPENGDKVQYFNDHEAAWRKHNEAKYPYRGQAQLGSKPALVQAEFQKLKQQYPEMEDADVLEMATKIATAASTKRTGQAATQEAIDQKAAEIKDINPGISNADAQIQAQRFVKVATATPSGNRIDQLRGRADQIKYATERIDEVEKILKRHKLITGFGGKIIGRPTEIVGNILGSNSTDYKQFERTVHELQQLMPRILTDSQGRPLGVEAGHIGSVVAGLNAGDTLQGTVRAYTELKKQLAEMATDTEKRIRGGADDDRPAKTAPPQAPGVPRWQQFSVPAEQQ